MILASFDLSNLLGILLFFVVGLFIGWWIWQEDGELLDGVREKNETIEREIAAVESDVRRLEGGTS